MDARGRDGYFNDALKWLRERHGGSNVVYAGIHRDETTPHMYAYVVPLDEATGRLNCRKWLGGAKALSEMQTDFADNVGARHGLERGIKGSRAKHQRVQRHYGLVNRAADQVAELGMLDRASLGVGKPTKKALEAIEGGDSYITLAQQHQARQKATKAREKALFEQGTSCATNQGTGRAAAGPGRDSAKAGAGASAAARSREAQSGQGRRAGRHLPGGPRSGHRRAASAAAAAWPRPGAVAAITWWQSCPWGCSPLRLWYRAAGRTLRHRCRPGSGPGPERI